jgi:hypothetical protein
MQLDLLHIRVVNLNGKVEVVEDVFLKADVRDGDAAVEDASLDVFLVDAVEELVQVLVENELYDEGHGVGMH